MDYNIAEELVCLALVNKDSPQERVEAALESFLSSHRDCEEKPRHGCWVHSLSHFTKTLWERRMDGWIKKFNEVSFKGAIELGDSNCSGRLVGDFADFAKWDDDPADFFLTAENLRWMDWEHYLYGKARIEAGPFQSEEDFLRWKLQHPEGYARFPSWGGIYDLALVAAEEMQSIIRRLVELGADAGEFNEFARQLLAKELNELEGRRPKAKEDWQKNELEKEIQKTRAGLAALV